LSIQIPALSFAPSAERSALLARGDILTEITQIDGCQTLGFGVAFIPEVNKKISDKIELWSKGKRAKEWACVLTGQMKFGKGGEALIVIEDAIDLPSYGLSMEHGISICLDDVAKIAEKYFVAGFLHSHPSENLTPSANDLAIALYIETAILSRPILHAIVSPSGRWLVWSFSKCRDCPNSFFALLRSEGSRKACQDE
jgi:proteasome lid subunit RPN8/RPN11